MACTMTILVPIDVSAPSRAAIDLAARLAAAEGLQTVILHVSSSASTLANLVDLYTLADPFHAEGRDARLRTVTGDPALVICSEALRRKARWIVMGTRGKGTKKSSVSAAVMARAEVPVIAIRPAPATKLGAPHGLLPKAQRNTRIAWISSRPGAGHLASYLASRLALGERSPAQEIPFHRGIPELTEGLAPGARWDLLVVGASASLLRRAWYQRLIEDESQTLLLVSEPNAQLSLCEKTQVLREKTLPLAASRHRG